MKVSLKSMLITCLFALPAAVFAFCPSAHAAEPARMAEDVKVQVNTELVHFANAQPFLDQHHTLQVPVRTMTDSLKYQLEWEQVGSAVRVTLRNETTNVTVTTGESSAVINGTEQTNSGPAASLVDGTVYMPFRLLADAFGIQTQWDQQNRIAILGVDGNYHAPAWYRTARAAGPVYVKSLQVQASAYTAAPGENGGFAALDFMGNTLKLGTIAVDPNVIPLGSKVYIEGYNHDGLPTGGMYAYATDIGSAVQGNRIDIFIPQGRQSALQFGIQQVQVHVLGT